jgi:hypothetical protein
MVMVCCARAVIAEKSRKMMKSILVVLIQESVLRCNDRATIVTRRRSGVRVESATEAVVCDGARGPKEKWVGRSFLLNCTASVAFHTPLSFIQFTPLFLFSLTNLTILNHSLNQRRYAHGITQHEAQGRHRRTRQAYHGRRSSTWSCQSKCYGRECWEQRCRQAVSRYA